MVTTTEGKHPTNLDLPQTLWDRAKAQAEKITGGSVNAYIVRALRAQVERDEKAAR